MHYLLDQLQRLGTKRQLDSLRSSKQIRYDRERTALDSSKQKCRPTLFDNATMNLSNFQVRIDLAIDRLKISLLTEKLKILPETLDWHLDLTHRRKLGLRQ
jgi:hypothetical protein